MCTPAFFRPLYPQPLSVSLCHLRTRRSGFHPQKRCNQPLLSGGKSRLSDLPRTGQYLQRLGEASVEIRLARVRRAAGIRTSFQRRAGHLPAALPPQNPCHGGGGAGPHALHRRSFGIVLSASDRTSVPVSGCVDRILCHPPGVWRSTAPGFLYPGGDHLHRAELPARSDSGGDCGCLQTQPQLFQQAVQREHGLSPAGISDPDALDQSHRADEDQQRTNRGNFNRMRLSEPAALYPAFQKAVRHLPPGVAHPEQTPLARLTALRSASFLYVTRLSDGAGTADSRLSAWAEDIPPASAHPRDRPLPRHSPGSRRTDQAP